MVGVPRSKGCKTCVQRRIKCDETRPHCQRCVKRGLECPGYGGTVKFQDEGPKLREHFVKKQHAFTVDVTDESSSSQSQSSTSSSPPNSQTSLELTHRHAPWAVSSTSDEDSPPYVPAFDYIMSPEAYQAQLFNLFVGGIVPTGLSQIPKRHRHHGNWLRSLMELPSESVTGGLSSAFRALSLSYLGRTNNLPFLVENSRFYYGQALKELSNIIRTSPDVEALSSTTLSTTMLLSFYEMFHPSVTNSWIRHAGGAGALMKARGPERATATHLDKVMFLAYRTAIMISAFEQSTPCFLAEPEWAAKSRELGMAGADDLELAEIEEDLFSQMSQIPTVICDYRKLEAFAKKAPKSLDTIRETRTEIVIRGLQHRQRLTRRFTQWSIKLKAAGQQPVPRAAKDPNEGLFQNQLHFYNTFQGCFHSGYWTIAIIINAVLADLLESARKEGVADPGNFDLGDVTKPAGSRRPPTLNPALIPLFPDTLQAVWNSDAEPSPSVAEDGEPGPLHIPDTPALLAENIQFATYCCKTYDYLSDNAFIGPFFLTFGLRVSLIGFPGDRERAWVRRKLVELGRVLGMAADLQAGEAQDEHVVDIQVD